MMHRLRLPLAVMLTASTLSGCYALDPEMKRTVEARKTQDSPAGPERNPALPDTAAKAPVPEAAAPEVDVRRVEVVGGMTALPPPSGTPAARLDANGEERATIIPGLTALPPPSGSAPGLPASPDLPPPPAPAADWPVRSAATV
ncbi:MAG: hypothetical protein ACT6Q3_16850, partial [Sphingopyxis sp.]